MRSESLQVRNTFSSEDKKRPRQVIILVEWEKRAEKDPQEVGGWEAECGSFSGKCCLSLKREQCGPCLHPLGKSFILQWHFIHAAISPSTVAMNDPKPCAGTNEAPFSYSKGFGLLVTLKVSILLPAHFFQMEVVTPLKAVK